MKVSRIVALLAALVLLPIASSAASSNVGEKRTERGPVSAVVRIEPDAVRIGDAVTLTVEVTAAAGVELLMPVFGASLERFAILEFVPRERIDEAGRTIATQRYRLQAPASGEHTIPPITIEFVDRRPGQRAAPEDEDAFELLTERLSFTVDSIVPETAGTDLKPPLGPLDEVDLLQTPRWPWAAAGGAVVLAAVIIVLIGRRMRSRTRHKTPYEVAVARLDALEAAPRPGAGAMDGFFVELSDIVRHYLEDRFGLHAPELTTEEFLDVAATSPDLQRNHRGFLQTFLQSADQVKFARHVPQAPDVETALSAVRAFLEQTSGDDSKAARLTPAGAEPAHA